MTLSLYSSIQCANGVILRYPNLDEGEKISKEAEFLSNEVDFKLFVSRLLKEEGIDLSQYKQNQMRRRLNMTLKQAGYDNYCKFLDYANTDEAVYRRFVDRITINVSEFIRNKEKFDTLEQRYMLPVINKKKPITIWSAGCSTGEEPYSLALLLEKHNAHSGSKILGWDFDTKALQKAKEGKYTAKALVNVSDNLKEKYFTKLDDDMFQVKDVLKNRCRLEKHNMLEERFPTGFDFILCRNVVIYFRDRAKEELFGNFARALSRDGVLMIGASERIPKAETVGLRAVEPFFYVRTESSIETLPSRRKSLG